MFRRTRTLAVAAAAVAVSAFGAAPASAVVALSGCDTPASAPVFAPWGDTTSYFLAPDGGFENGAAGWVLDGASVVDGNESFNLSGPGASSLRLDSGDSATSPAVCVGIEHPTFRFVAKKRQVRPASVVVSVVTERGLELPVGLAAAGSSWNPSPVMLVVANLLPSLTGTSSTDVRFRFTGLTGSVQIDDVFIDPRGGG